MAFRLSTYILFREGSSSIPVGIVSLGEAAVDAVVDGGAVVLDDQPGAVAADGVHSEPAALVLPAVAVVQIVRSADRLRGIGPGGLGRCELWSFRWLWFSINLLLKRYAEPRKSLGTWLREISSCSCLTFLPGPA